MDNSQSSDFLSESTDIFCNSPTDPAIVDTVIYESLVLNTKSAFTNIRKEIRKSTFSVYFSTLLQDCGTCISQSLDLISNLLVETDLKHDKLKEYMNDAVSLLQLLSDLLKHVIESIAMACCSMKSFPTATGQIIMLVFTHCRDSEILYGNQLNYVEKQLKDLFRTCHELQLTYLMVIEKHFIFDLAEKEEQDILIETLDINLKIGEIVQSLDVKTMAEQWKTYTMICDKYYNCLLDKKIFSDCTKILSSMVTSHIRTALEKNQEEKIVLRSLKVSSFTLKILLRVCNTFKHAVIKDHDSIVELLLYVHLNNEAYLHTMCGKSAHFVTLVNNNVTNPVNILLNELLADEKLLDCICNYNINDIRKDDNLLGFIILIISILRILVQKSIDQSFKVSKHRLINAVYNILPHSHVWLNMGLKFKSDESSRQFQTYGLYEHLLTHTLAFAATMNNEEVNVLEKRMLEAILSTDCYSALFSSNLWVLIARISNRQFLLAQVISLSEIYKKLEHNNLVADSPQKVHLSKIISSLFEVMQYEDKLKIYNLFNINDDTNIALWTCLKLGSLPNEIQLSAEENVLEMVKINMRNMTNGNVDIYDLINVINLASTCSTINRKDEMESFLIQAWSKACPTNIQNIAKRLNKGTEWYYRYIEALASLTNSMEHIFHGSSANLVKVLHTISHIVQIGCKEFKLLLINILCKLTSFDTYNNMNKHLVDSILTQTFSKLFQDTDFIVKNKLFNMLRKYRSNSLDRIVSNVVNEDDSFQDTWGYFHRHGRLKRGDFNLKEQLLFTMDLKYTHRCLENFDDCRDPGTVKKSLSNNFDFVDIDSLFDAESDAEPACKKAKLNTNEVEQIITRLESDASSLCKIKENIFSSEYLNRIKNVCNKLNNIID